MVRSFLKQLKSITEFTAAQRDTVDFYLDIQHVSRRRNRIAKRQLRKFVSTVAFILALHCGVLQSAHGHTNSEGTDYRENLAPVITVVFGDEYSSDLLKRVLEESSECEISLVSKPEFENGIAVVSGQRKKGSITIGGAAANTRELCQELSAEIEQSAGSIGQESEEFTKPQIEVFFGDQFTYEHVYESVTLRASACDFVVESMPELKDGIGLKFEDERLGSFSLLGAALDAKEMCDSATSSDRESEKSAKPQIEVFYGDQFTYEHVFQSVTLNAAGCDFIVESMPELENGIGFKFQDERMGAFNLLDATINAEEMCDLAVASN